MKKTKQILSVLLSIFIINFSFVNINAEEFFSEETQQSFADFGFIDDPITDSLAYQTIDYINYELIEDDEKNLLGEPYYFRNVNNDMELIVIDAAKDLEFVYNSIYSNRNSTLNTHDPTYASGIEFINATTNLLAVLSSAYEAISSPNPDFAILLLKDDKEDIDILSLSVNGEVIYDPLNRINKMYEYNYEKKIDLSMVLQHLADF